MAKQSAADRIKRLESGRCPVHGIGMSQVDLWDGKAIVKCDRRDCDIKGVERHPDPKVTLLPNWQHLIES